MHLRGGVLGVYVSLVDPTLTSSLPYVRSHAPSEAAHVDQLLLIFNLSLIQLDRTGAEG